MGGLAIGGGALLGSGAFTSVEAERDVEVTISSNVSEDFVDVLVQVDDYETVEVRNNAGSGHDADGFVSLVEAGDNAVLSFGDLPPDSTVTYNDLFKLQNDDNGDSDTDDFNVELVLADSNNDFLNIGGDEGGTGPTTVGEGNEKLLEGEVETGQNDDTTTLTITITEA
ncbi:hypothetical protein BRC65_08150 [Halobacteriales archaeon QH_2_65_14]|nr:MAG: hypothetical protein BRC65_08150 [Halobacteriales archaeon QH_2_65_14]